MFQLNYSLIKTLNEYQQNLISSNEYNLKNEMIKAKLQYIKLNDYMLLIYLLFMALHQTV